MLAQSFLRHFSNGFVNTLEQIRTPHLDNVLCNLRDFATKVPSKYSGSMQKALRTSGFLSFILARASLSLLCARATLPRNRDGDLASLHKVHEQLATVVEEVYIAAMLHAEERWYTEFKEDRQFFIEVATAFIRHAADPRTPEVLRLQAEVLFGPDANPRVWSKYGIDLLGLSFGFSLKAALPGKQKPSPSRKVSLLGGDSLYATAHWAMANVDSRACRKLIAKTIAGYSDGQLRKREIAYCTDVTIQEYLHIEREAGVATFFRASTACAALVNCGAGEIADQLAEFGSDIGLLIALLKEVKATSIRSCLKSGRISAPIIFALERDPEVREALHRTIHRSEELEDIVGRVEEHGIKATMVLVNRIGTQAAARLECLEDTVEKDALLTVTLGLACLPPRPSPSAPANAAGWPAEGGEAAEEQTFRLTVENLRLHAQYLRLQRVQDESQEQLDAVRYAAIGTPPEVSLFPSMTGLGLENSAAHIDWLLFRGLGRCAPLPHGRDPEDLLSCIAADQAEVQKRLLALGDLAESRMLRRAVRLVFSAGGKRLRPALCHLVHQMLEGAQEGAGTEETKQHSQSREDILTLATAIEIIHTASLVHDDILDDAGVRRQQETIHRVLGPDVAVLSGDFLFAHATSLIESLDNDEVTRLVSLVLEQFGYGELSQGTKRFDTELSLLDYMKKSFYKTASLLAAACRASAELTGSSKAVCDVMYSYGFYLGIAFQIADDILDFVSTSAELGKPAGQDLRSGVLTAPVILCLHGSDDLNLAASPCADELRNLLERQPLDDPSCIQKAVELVHQGGGVDMAQRLAERMADEALEALMLAAPEESEARRALAGLTRWVIQRNA